MFVSRVKYDGFKGVEKIVSDNTPVDSGSIIDELENYGAKDITQITAEKYMGLKKIPGICFNYLQVSKRDLPLFNKYIRHFIEETADYIKIVSYISDQDGRIIGSDKTTKFNKVHDPDLSRIIDGGTRIWIDNTPRKKEEEHNYGRYTISNMREFTKDLKERISKEPLVL